MLQNVHAPSVEHFQMASDLGCEPVVTDEPLDFHKHFLHFLTLVTNAKDVKKNLKTNLCKLIEICSVSTCVKH